ncbi:hypothetical protein AOLI_G00054200 [Acnodon oligacanthus]
MALGWVLCEAQGEVSLQSTVYTLALSGLNMFFEHSSSAALTVPRSIVVKRKPSTAETVKRIIRVNAVGLRQGGRKAGSCAWCSLSAGVWFEEEFSGGSVQPWHLDSGPVKGGIVLGCSISHPQKHTHLKEKGGPSLSLHTGTASEYRHSPLMRSALVIV